MATVGSRGRLTSDTPKLYETSYQAFHGDRVHDPGSKNFTSFFGLPRKTGFISNQRPVVHYRPSLDLIDNPRFGILLSGSYTSQTKQHYQPHFRSDCAGPLPNIVNRPRDSGFYQLRYHPRTVGGDDKTEFQQSFVPQRLTPKVSLHHVTVGPKRETGFTEGTDLHLITFQEKNRNLQVDPQQLHSSVMKNDFLPPSFLQGPEATPGLRSRSCRETGFTRGTDTLLTCPTSPPTSLPTKMTAPTVKTVGKKEPTGSLLNAPNNQTFPDTPFDSSHFTTHYQSKFCYNADLKKLRSGHTAAGIIGTKMNSGFGCRDMDRYIFRG